MKDLVSIIVNIYNNEDTLKSCIVSLISQTYRELEIILVDDGSTDSSSKICDDLILTNSRMKVIHQIHSGINNSMNAGIDIATGKYITFVNASDTIKKDMIEVLYKMMENYPIDISVCSIKENKTLTIQNETNTVITLSKEDSLRQLLLEKNIKNTIYGKLFKRELFNTIKFKCDNTDLLFRLFEISNKIAFINNFYYYSSSLESFPRNSIINNDIRIMKLYPNLEIYCQYNILKNLQNEFYECICNNIPIPNQENMYRMFMQIINDNEDKISPFLSYNRKAHMYLLADNFNTYKRICPVLPEIDFAN